MVEALPVLSGLGWERKLGTQALNVPSADVMDSKKFTKDIHQVPALGLQYRLGDVRSAKLSVYGSGRD